MTYQYQRPPETRGLRLHLNENTAGCSPRIAAALRELTREQAAFYPDYSGLAEAVAHRFDVPPDAVLLTNGLDEGILMASLVALRGSRPDDPYEAIVVQPAFDMYEACADAVGGRIVNIQPRPDLAFPLEQVVAAVSARTRLIFLTSPNNPTGLSIRRDDVAAVARAAPHATVLLDEAYADFGGATMMPEAAAGVMPNLIVGRTFAKAYGLAGLRVGALIGSDERLAPMRRGIPPYSLNVYAAAALPVALDDAEYYRWYLGEVHASKQLLYELLTRHAVPYWPSDGNFVLARFGDGLGAVVAALAARGIAIRDRSADPGCQGCARITAGVVEHTRRLAAALEEVLCGAR